MATVYLGRISGAGGFQRFVAIKRLHPHLAREPEFIQMFLDEARLAARIHHPNVVPILEIGASEQGYYSVMEYVEGDRVARLIAQAGRGKKPVTISVGARGHHRHMLTGLHAAHELADDDGHPLKIVHRDVSPQNVLVGVDGSSRLSDFGVARATSKLSTTQNGQLKGKLAYMAPEQARGAKDIDRRADVFAAGVVLWETLSGERLFKGDGEADTFNKVLNEPIPLLGAALPAPPAALEKVLARALHRDREERYPTAAAFADDVERAVREVDAVGTHKDVAAYLYAVLGTEIAQQRDAVRTWIARDPSRPRGLGTPQPPGVHGQSSASAVSGVSQRGQRREATPSNSGHLVAGEPSSGALPPAAESSRGWIGASGSGGRGAWPWVVVVLGLAGAAAGWLRWGRAPDVAAPPGRHRPGGAAHGIVRSRERVGRRASGRPRPGSIWRCGRRRSQGGPLSGSVGRGRDSIGPHGADRAPARSRRPAEELRVGLGRWRVRAGRHHAQSLPIVRWRPPVTGSRAWPASARSPSPCPARAARTEGSR